jgi:hypothetical protein
MGGRKKKKQTKAMKQKRAQRTAQRTAQKAAQKKRLRQESKEEEERKARREQERQEREAWDDHVFKELFPEEDCGGESGTTKNPHPDLLVIEGRFEEAEEVNPDYLKAWRIRTMDVTRLSPKQTLLWFVGLHHEWELHGKLSEHDGETYLDLYIWSHEACMVCTSACLTVALFDTDDGPYLSKHAEHQFDRRMEKFEWERFCHWDTFKEACQREDGSFKIAVIVRPSYQRRHRHIRNYIPCYCGVEETNFWLSK